MVYTLTLSHMHIHGILCVHWMATVYLAACMNIESTTMETVDYYTQCTTIGCQLYT